MAIVVKKGMVIHMNKIKVYGLEQEELWIEVLKNFPQSDVYYQPGYVKSFWINGDGEPLLISYENEYLRAVNVVMKRPVLVKQSETEEDKALNEYFDYVTPYGYGGFLLAGNFQESDLEDLKDTYETFCKNEKIVAEFVRFHPVTENAHKVETLYQIIDLGHTVKMDTSSREIIWKNITSKNRNVIRKAQKSGVKIYWGREPHLFDEFEQIYNATMDKVKASSYYYFKKPFYESILEDLKYHSIMFYAKLNDEIIAMSILLFGKNQAHYHLSASKPEFQSMAPTNLLLYEAACYVHEMGMTSLHLGGGLGSGKDHLYSFKKQFNRQMDCTFSIGKKIYNQEIYDRLCQLNQSPPDATYFPRYRA